MMGLSPAGTALNLSVDLGLGGALNQQVDDLTEEEKRKRRLGMSELQSPAGIALMSNPFPKGY
jgi:hypothetical protein